MEGTGQTGEVTAVCQFETGQQGNFLAKDFAPEEKNRKQCRASERLPEGTWLPKLNVLNIRGLDHPAIHFLNVFPCFPEGWAKESDLCLPQEFLGIFLK
jgi:hypothetical protein